MNLIVTAFNWLAGKNNTGIQGTTDLLSNQYRDYLPGLETPQMYTTGTVAQEVARAATLKAQADLAKTFHDARRSSIRDLDTLDRQNAETAVLYSETALGLSDRRSKAQEKILPNQARTQINNSRINAMRVAYARGLEIHSRELPPGA